MFESGSFNKKLLLLLEDITHLQQHESGTVVTVECAAGGSGVSARSIRPAATAPKKLIISGRTSDTFKKKVQPAHSSALTTQC